MSQAILNIGDIARNLLIVLSNRGSRTLDPRINLQRLQNLFENIIPYYNIPGQYIYHPPLVQPTAIQHSWDAFFSQNTLNHYYNGRLTVEVDRIIGEAIQNRIQRRTGIRDPHPYHFQVEAIVSSLNLLDPVRRALRSRTLSLLQNFTPYPSIISVIAPTGGGKTEIFETLAMQLSLDAHMGRLDPFTKAIIAYPMKAFMIEHFRRFAEDLTYINTRLSTNISIGLLDGDTPDTLNINDVLPRLSYLMGGDLCPLCNSRLSVTGSAPHFTIMCNNGHRLNVRIAKDMIFQYVPDILLTTIDSFNYILLESERQILLGAPQACTSHRVFPPILLALDEPHIYTGVFGSNVSLVLRAFEYMVQAYANSVGLQSFRPLKIVTSATMPNPNEFLARLFVENPQEIAVITPNFQTGSQNIKGFMLFLPQHGRGLGFQNLLVELTPVLAAILPRDYRKIIVFVDSVMLAEQLRRYIEDYIKRGLPDYLACYPLFQQDVINPQTGRFNQNSIRVAVHTAHLDRMTREEIEEGIRRTPPTYNIVIATPTLELGIDIGDITAVILAGLPPTPEKLAQRAGRAGRRSPGLIVVVGNEVSAVDRYYLSDYNRAVRYLQMSVGAAGAQQYMLPLNPINLESIRRFLGNFMACYARVNGINRVSSLQTHNTNLLNDYLSIAVNRPISSFSRCNLPIFQNISSFALNIRNRLRGELMQRFQEILTEFRGSHITDFVAPEVAKRRYFSGRINFIPILDNVRSSNREVEIQYYANVQPPSSGMIHPNHRIEINAVVALAHHAIKYIEPSNNPWHYYFLNLNSTRSYTQGLPLFSLRGSLRYLSLRGTTRLFEVAGLFYSQLDALNRYGDLRQAIDELNTNINLIGNSCLQTEEMILRAWSGRGAISRIIRSRTKIYRLMEAVDNWLNSSHQNSPYIVEPRALYLFFPGFLATDNNNSVIRIGSRAPHDLIPLDYFEVAQSVARRTGHIYWEFSKIPEINCPYCGSSDVQLVGFNRNNLYLELYCRRCRRDFMFRGRVSSWFIDMIRTKPLILGAIVRTDPSDRRIIRGSPFEIAFYREIDVFLGNVGFFISSINRVSGRRARKFVRTRVRGGNEQYILGFRFRTQALELLIDWSLISQRIGFSGRQEIFNEYSLLGVNIQPTLNIWNDFIIRTTHTLSHLLINFAPIYTGGNRWDINEYIGFTVDERGNITSSSVIVFDSDEGGNGVSELAGYFLRDIMSTAISEATNTYLRQHDPLIRFLGEPGITFFGTWPICPYENIALSRSLTLILMQRLLGLQNIQQLCNLTGNQLLFILPSL